ncbi:MAG TPA: glycosyltransferase family 2 protein [Candidatus Eisenbacteria bacterium]|jgi:cellulose synthase/poly-beta-1,6-N-acetylglucosamine synthase-like glycosyltransferase|nr:glycosyltransferase family 2 protein [Candidatus Eisenbacteria bacterium]
MDNLFVFLALAEIAVGLYLVYEAIRWLGYARRRNATDPGFYSPRTAVLCPCKGVEPGLERNLTALCEFDHQNYEVFFALASESDPAASIVKRVVAGSHGKAHVIIAGAPQECGEKINNLRAAIEQLTPDFEVLVFADSDGRPGRSWLRRLTGPLTDSRIGATTTMRWIIANNNELATLLLAAWNAPIVTMLGENTDRNFCWGGGTAIRRSVFDQSAVLEEWSHSVSDDYSMTNALQRRNLPIVFLPECLTASYIENDFGGLMEFTNRQILITRVYSSKMWMMAGLTQLLFSATILLGVFVTLKNLFTGHPATQFAALTFLPLLLAAIRGAIRVTVAQEMLSSLRSQIQQQAWIHLLIGVWIPYLYCANFISSACTRTMRWRGIRYELVSPHQTRIVNR